jgi:hypothetical protein
MDAHAKNLSQFSTNLRTVSIALHTYAKEIEQRALLNGRMRQSDKGIGIRAFSHEWRH